MWISIILMCVGSGILIDFLVRNSIFATFKNGCIVGTAIMFMTLGAAQLGEQKGLDAQQPPTIPRVQQLLIDEGYDIGPKGVDGVAGTLTVRYWTEWSQATIEHENHLKCK